MDIIFNIIGYLAAGSPLILLIWVAVYARRSWVLIGAALVFFLYMIALNCFFLILIGLGEATSPASDHGTAIFLSISGIAAVIWIGYLIYLPTAIKRGRRLLDARRQREEAPIQLENW